MILKIDKKRAARLLKGAPHFLLGQKEAPENFYCKIKSQVKTKKTSGTDSEIAMLRPGSGTAWTAGMPGCGSDEYHVFSLLNAHDPAFIKSLLNELNIAAPKRRHSFQPAEILRQKLKKIEAAAVYSYLIFSVILTVIFKIALIPAVIVMLPLVPVINLVRIAILIPVSSLAVFLGGAMEVSSRLAYDLDWGNADYDTCLGRSYSGGLLKGLAVASLPIWGPFLFGFVTSDAPFGMRLVYGLAATLTFVTLFGSNTLLSLFQLGGIAESSHAVKSRMSAQGWTMTRQDLADLDSCAASAAGVVAASKIIRK